MPKTASIIKPLLSKKFLKKRSARILAIQCLYSININNSIKKTIDEKIEDIILIYTHELPQSKLSKADVGYLIFLVRSAVERKEEIETLISQNLLEEWKLNRLAKVIQAILKVGVAELKASPELDKAIVLNEYIEIARYFGHDGDVGFINHVLDKIATSQ